MVGDAEMGQPSCYSRFDYVAGLVLSAIGISCVRMDIVIKRKITSILYFALQILYFFHPFLPQVCVAVVGGQVKILFYIL